MKYVIFKYKSIFFPVVMTEQCTHSEVKIVGAVPISAGFCSRNKLGLLEVIPEMGSDSLGLLPGANDEQLLLSLIMDAPASSFLDYESLDPENDEK